MNQPELVEVIRANGIVYKAYKAGEFSEFVLTEQAKWKRISNEMGIKAEQ